MEMDEAGELRVRILTLLRNAGDKSTCGRGNPELGCGATIYWIRHLNGRLAPYSEAGLNHFIDCPNAGQFRKKKTYVPEKA